MSGPEDIRRCQTLWGWRKRGIDERCLKDCSLVVPTYRRPNEVVSLLDTLLALSSEVPQDVVVVDGDPVSQTDEVALRWATAHNPPFHLSYVRSPKGLTLQRNVGIDATSSDLVFFLDDDCLPHAGYFAAIRKVFLDDTERKVGGVAGTMINVMGAPISLRWRLRFALGLVPTDWPPWKYYPTATSAPPDRLQLFGGTREVDILPGGVAAWRREVFGKHRFSQFFRGYAQGEDLEMSLRVGQSWRLLWCGDAHVEHNHAPGGRPPSVERGMMQVRNRYFIWRRYTRQPRLGIRARFWGDIAYIFLWDLAAYAIRPRQLRYLAHAWGVLRGGVSCLTNPPIYHAPPARAAYQFELVELSRLSQTTIKCAPISNPSL